MSQRNSTEATAENRAVGVKPDAGVGLRVRGFRVQGSGRSRASCSLPVAIPYVSSDSLVYCD